MTVTCIPCDREIADGRASVDWVGGEDGEHRLVCPECGVPIGEDGIPERAAQ